jgi:hypothetical protein
MLATGKKRSWLASEERLTGPGLVIRRGSGDVAPRSGTVATNGSAKLLEDDVDMMTVGAPPREPPEVSGGRPRKRKSGGGESACSGLIVVDCGFGVSGDGTWMALCM